MTAESLGKSRYRAQYQKVGFNHPAKAHTLSTTFVSIAKYQEDTQPAGVQMCTHEQQKVNVAPCPQGGDQLGIRQSPVDLPW